MDSARDLIEYAPPLSTDSVAAVRRPPVWLTVVGHGGVWPLKVYSQYQDKDYVFPAAPIRADRKPPWPLNRTRLGFSSVLFLLFSLFCLANCLGYWKVVDWPNREELPTRWRPIEVLRPSHCPRHQREHRRLLLVCFGILLALYAYLATLCLVQPAISWKLGYPLSPLDWVRIIWSIGCFHLLLLTTLAVLFEALGPGMKLFRIEDTSRPANVQKHGEPSVPAAGTKEPKKWIRRWALPTLVLTLVPLLLLGVVIVLSFLLVRGVISPQMVTAVLFYERATNLASGISPVVPVLFLGAGLYLWSVCHLRRVRLLDTASVSNPLANSTGLAGAGIKNLENQLRRVLNAPFQCLPRLLLPLILIILGVPLLVILLRFFPTFEGQSFDAIFKIALLVLYIGIALAFLQFLSLWHYFRQVLQRLVSHPMVGAYDRLPLRISRTLGRQLLARLPTLVELDLSVQRWFLLANHFDKDLQAVINQLDPQTKLSWRLTTILKAAQKAERFVQDGQRRNGDQPVGLPVFRYRTQKHLSSAARILMGTLECIWKERTLNPLVKEDDSLKIESCPPDKPTTELYLPASSIPAYLWTRLAEDIVAIQVATFVSMIFVHLRNLLTFVTAGALLMLLAVTSYPFQPQRLLTIFMWMVILTSVIGSLTVFIQAGRDEVLSRIAKTSPNRVTFDRTFMSMVVTYGLLPLLGLLATELPEIQGLFSWMEPVLRAFK
jgi:hypothetical protein